MVSINENTIRQALYTFKTGEWHIHLQDHQPDPDTFINMMVSEFQQAIQRVYQLGVRKIAIVGLGPVGCIPAGLFLPNTYQCRSQMHEQILWSDRRLWRYTWYCQYSISWTLRWVAAFFFLIFAVNLCVFSCLKCKFLNVSSACCGSEIRRGLSQYGVGT